MVVIESIWITTLFVASLIPLVGTLWVLRVAIDWWLEVDYVKAVRRWMK